MNYDESLAYIESLAPTILNPDLARFDAFMKLHGAPQNSFKTLHVAGTNGKGSTVAIIDSVLRASGYKVGRFTGPHLLKWNERFHLDGQPIDDDAFAVLASKVQERSVRFGADHLKHGALTWFEVLTAMAFFHFAQSKVDFAVIEVGLGGRWDATNVIENPVVNAITTIDYDHVHILGSTLRKIAAEKAGIIKRGVPIVTGTTGEALDTISARAIEMQAPITLCRAPNMVTGPDSINTEAFDKAVANLALVGNYQRQNALIAFTVLKVAETRTQLSLCQRLESGFETAYWPGRFQWLPEPGIVLDGAHNVAGARALRSALDDYFPKKPRTFILSFFQNKDIEGALKSLLRPNDRVVASQCHSPRAVASAADIVRQSENLGATAISASSVAQALQMACQNRRADDLIVVTGSFATVKETMVGLGWHSVQDGFNSTYGLGQESCKIHKQRSR